MKAQQSQQGNGNRGGFARAILQKGDIAEAVVCHRQSKVNHMNTRHIRMKWLLPFLGIALVASSFKIAATYLDLQQEFQSEQEFTATLDRLYADQRISFALKTLRDGDPGMAAQRLDLLLCENILRLNAKLGSASDRQRAYVSSAFATIARLRPRNSEFAAGAAQELSNDQIEAERILAEAYAGVIDANEAVAASP
jgi:hypothetical protein